MFELTPSWQISYASDFYQVPMFEQLMIDQVAGGPNSDSTESLESVIEVKDASTIKSNQWSEPWKEPWEFITNDKITAAPNADPNGLILGLWLRSS